VPATKLIAVYSGRGVQAVFRYLQNTVHPNHLDVRISSLQDNGVLGTGECGAGTVDALHKLNSRPSAGRKTAVHGTWKILTFPPESWLTKEECNRFAQRIVDGLARGPALV
jgi:hypothetical protein